MKKAKRQGVWIPATIYEDSTLTWTQKLMLVEIASFCNNGRECYVSNEHLGTFLQVSNSQVVKVMRTLVDRGLVIRKFVPYEDGNRRILSVADAVVAMASERPYRRGLDNQEIIDEIEKFSGSQFDPLVVKVFVEILKDEEVEIFVNSAYSVDMHGLKPVQYLLGSTPSPD